MASGYQACAWTAWTCLTQKTNLSSWDGVRPEEFLSLGELVETRTRVVSIEVLDEDRDEQARLAEAALGELAEQLAHGMPLAVEIEIELADPGPAGQDGVHLGVGGCPLQPCLTDQELPACSFQSAPVLIGAAVMLHYASQPVSGLGHQRPLLYSHGVFR